MSDSDGGHPRQPMTRERLQKELEDPGSQLKRFTAVNGASGAPLSV